MSRIFHIACVLLAILFVSAGCDLLATGGSVQLTTDQDVFVADSTSTITLMVTNRSKRTIYYICTGQIYLEERQGGRITDTWQIHGFEECLAQRPIEPDDSETFDLSFGDHLGFSRLLDEAAFDNSVHYRLRADLFHDSEFRRPLDESQRVSNWFTILR